MHRLMGLSAHHAGIGIHTEEGVLAHRFTPFCGTEDLRGEDFNEQSWCTILKWYGMCSKGEDNCGHTEGEWLPSEIYPQALTLKGPA